MAINQQPQQGGDPEITYRDPRAYIAYLRTRGLNVMQIDDLVRQRFGAGQTPENRQREAARNAQTSGLAQTGGMIGGALIAQEGLRGFPTVSGWLGSGAGSGAGAGAGTATGTAIGAGTAGAGATGAGAVTLTGGGVATIPAGAAVPAGYTAVGTSASGATMVAPTSMAGTTGATSLGSIGSVALPVAAAALTANSLWESGMKDIVRGKGDKADYTNIGLAAGTMGLSEVGNIGLRLLGKRSIGAMMKTGKSGAQQIRDSFRSDLQESGVADDKYNVTLADGTKFDIGLDGKTKYQNVGENIDGKKTRNAWDVDFSNPLAKFASDKIDPMIRNIYGADDPKAKFFPGQYTGMLVNAATSNAKSEADVLANIETMLGKSKFAQQAGVGVTPPPPAKAAKGQVVRVSAGMYVNDKGQVKPAKSVGEALRANYNKSKEKEKK